MANNKYICIFDGKILVGYYEIALLYVCVQGSMAMKVHQLRWASFNGFSPMKSWGATRRPGTTPALRCVGAAITTEPSVFGASGHDLKLGWLELMVTIYHPWWSWGWWILWTFFCLHQVCRCGIHHRIIPAMVMRLPATKPWVCPLSSGPRKRSKNGWPLIFRVMGHRRGATHSAG